MVPRALIFVCVIGLATCCFEENSDTLATSSVRKYATAIIKGTSEIRSTLRIPTHIIRSQENAAFNFRYCGGALNCKNNDSTPFTLSWNASEINGTADPKSVPKPRCFRYPETASRPIPVHFAQDGTFFDGTYYYTPEGDYCLDSHADTSITLKLCPVHTDQRIFLPKCCPMNEVIYRGSTCKKLSKNQPNWKPELYLTDSDGSHSIFKYDPTNLKMFNEDLPSQCKKIEPQPYPFFFYLSPTGLGTGLKHNVKLAVQKDKPGNVIPLIFNANLRQWELKEHLHYCVDAVYLAKGVPQKNRTVYYAGNPNDFVMYVCSSDDPDIDTWQPGRAWTYSITTAISSAFLLVTVIIYLLTLKQHNLHGLTVLMYIIAMLGRYLFACIAYFISIYPNDHITGVTSRGWICVSISIVGHYFYLSCPLWLTIMNFNFLQTFRKTLVVQRKARHLKTLLIFSAFGWGLPVILVTIFVMLDIIYRDPLTMVPVPGYGEMVCFVARPFRGYYVYAPMGIILGLNIPLILFTLGIFWNARMARKKQLGESIFLSATASDYSAAFFIKQFVIMGGGDLVSLLTWYFHKPIQEEAVKPVWVIVLEGGSFLTPVLLFHLFCLNRRTRKQLANMCS